MGIIGKKLGKLLFLEEGRPPADEPRIYKYPGNWYHVQCDCGTDKWVPRPGSAGLRSCGCMQYDHLKVNAYETISYTPAKTVVNFKKTQYNDL